MDKYQLAVIGAGPGGYVAAIRAAQLGLKTALIEKDAKLGGTCLNVGCIPSKALLESSELYFAARHRFAEHGIMAGGVTFDLKTLMARKNTIVGELTDGISVLMKKNKVTVLQGRAAALGGGRVAVEREGARDEVEADAVLLALGSVPIELPSMPFDGRRIVTSTEALSFDRVPGHLVVVGAGAVGLELGSVWSRLGSKVTVVELLPRVVPFADKQMSQFLEKSLRKQGIEFKLSSQVTEARVQGEQVEVSVKDAKGDIEKVVCDRLLVAVGRKPASSGQGLEAAGVALDEKGRVKTDARYATTASGIFAIGDLIAGPMLAHKAEEEGVAVAELLAGRAGHVNYEAIPNIVYTAPELAQVGMTEEEAKEKGIPVRVGKFYFQGNGRAKALGETEGLVKVVAHATTDRLLGVHILGARASEMIAEAAVAMEFHASAEDLARSVHAHPTLSEIVKEAALAVDKRSIHG